MAENEVTAYEDYEFNPTIEPKSSKAWLNLIEDAEKKFSDYQDRCDEVDKLYADLAKLANISRERAFQIFWANIQVIGPSIYARPPIPVVVPKFKDRKPIPRAASEMLERACISTFDKNNIDRTMRQVRDDLTITARGQLWVRYETKAESDSDYECVKIEHLDRKDFLHDPARKWQDVDWVAFRAWMTRKKMKKRFKATSGDAYLEADFAVRDDERKDGMNDPRQTAGVWEIWCRSENRVYWVTEGVDVLLDEGEPHLSLSGFFPCPEPAYSTLQRRTLIPVPDVLFYKDQLEEINELTGRIHDLSEGLKAKGFYPAGAGEIGDAIEAAIKSNSNNAIMIPISNWAAFGGGAAKDTIVWLPIDMISTTIVQCVEMRRQLIDDVYQITGLSDIMRGQTDPKETLGAQQIKQQYGSVRIRDRQNELVRIARDAVMIAAEIMAENFSPQTLMIMTQLELPRDTQIKQQVQQLKQQAQQIAQQVQQAQQQAQQQPQIAPPQQGGPQGPQQPGQPPQPDPAQQMMQQAQAQLGQLQQQAQKLLAQPTVEKVTAFLRDERLRPFVLDIETDSTIQPDEDAEKQRVTEFMGMMGQTLRQLGELIQLQPQAAPFAGQLLKFATKPFRAGRELEGAIDEFIEQAQQQAKQPRPDPEAEKIKAEKEADEKRMAMEAQMREREQQGKERIEQIKADADAQRRQQEGEQAFAEHQAKLDEMAAAERRDQQKHQQEMIKLNKEIELMTVKVNAQFQTAQITAASKAQEANFDAQRAEQEADQSERSFEQASALTEQKARRNGPG